jgi:Flp pilus assembly pilin Flp
VAALRRKGFQTKRRNMKLQELLNEDGAATAEYAIATMAAVAFAGLLVVIMRSPEVKDLLFGLVKSALTFTNPNG